MINFPGFFIVAVFPLPFQDGEAQLFTKCFLYVKMPITGKQLELQLECTTYILLKSIGVALILGIKAQSGCNNGSGLVQRGK